MKTILIKEGCPNPISLGEKGENGVSAVLFDYSEWISDFGEGAISLLVKRKGDQSAYPVVLSTADGIATWTISDTDTAVQGYGKAEYVFTIDSKIAKSAVFSFYVAADLGPAGDPPDPYESWIDTLTALGGETLINAQAAQAAQEAAETAQSNAETAATNAATSATAAAQSAGAARDMAASALSSADSASASATAASGHATAAEAAKDLAISAAEDAQHSETQAELSASAAAESAESASGSATTATTAANNASASASSASASATAASGSASAAATSAGQAAESAEKADIDLLKLLPTDTASGSIASFSDGASDVPVKALSVALEPIQNLNGQSSPYPSGGGKQMIPLTVENIKALNTAGSWSGNAYTRNGVTFTITLNAVGAVSGIRANGTATGTVKFIFGEVDIKNGVEYVISGFDNLPSNTFGNINPALTGTSDQNLYANKTGTADADKTMVVSFYVTSGGSLSNKDLTPMVCVSSASNPTVFAPYENICPITGHTAAQVWRAGKNLLSPNWSDYAVGYNYSYMNDVVKEGQTARFTFTDKDTSVDVSGVYFGFQVGLSDAERSPTAYRWAVANGQIQPNTTNISSDGLICTGVFAYRNTEEVFNKIFSRWNVMVEYGTTATDFEAYQPIVNISIPLGQTVYGGVIDVVGGVLTVDRAMVDMGDLSWSVWNEVFYADVSGKQNRTQANDVISTAYAPSSRNATGASDARQFMSDFSVCGFYSTTSTSSYVYVKDSRYTLADNFKPAVTGQKIVYALATPITIDLTDIPELTTLLGQNNIWSDSGDVSVEYRADIQRYIAKVIAEALA